MIRHVILWTLKEELTAEEKAEIKKGIKENVEGLKEKLPGIVEMQVHINGLPSSNVDILLDSVFTDIDAMNNYMIDPVHVKVAETYVRPYIGTRSCIDLEI